MASEFEALRDDLVEPPPFPSANRRPDWRSSSAKRLMPQLQIKAPTLNMWLTKLAVAVDRAFFDAIGRPSPQPSNDITAGDIIWLVAGLKRSSPGTIELTRNHWEVLTLDKSTERLKAADTVSKSDFETVLRSRLKSL